MKTPLDTGPLLINSKQLAQLLGFGHRNIARLNSAGKIPRLISPP
jgi:hypothetical protein